MQRSLEGQFSGLVDLRRLAFAHAAKSEQNRLRAGTERHEVCCFLFRKDRPIAFCFCWQN